MVGPNANIFSHTNSKGVISCILFFMKLLWKVIGSHEIQERDLKDEIYRLPKFLSK